MKRNILLLLIFIAAQFSLQAQCVVPGSVTFHSQFEIDHFPIQYPGCTSIFGNLRVEASDLFTITNLEALSQIETIGGNLIIQNNPDLVSLAGLDQISQVGGRLAIQNNPELISIAGLHGLVAVDQDFRLIGNASVINFSGIENLQEIGGSFTIQDNDGLFNFEGLDKLVEIKNDFSIKENEALIDLKGIESLSLISGQLMIDDNNSLVSLNALEALDPLLLTNLEIINNSNLAICNEPFVCGYLMSTGSNEIHSNALDCESSYEIMEACTTTTTQDLSGPNFLVSPNPTQGKVVIIFDENQTGQLQILNGIGKVILEQKVIAVSEVDLDAFANGVYFFKIKVEGKIWTQKIIKL